MAWIDKKRWLVTGCGALTLSAGGSAWLARRARADGIPPTNALHYSGTLLEKGVPVDGPRDITLVLWDDAQAGAAADQLCITQAGSTPVAAGRFEVPLADGCTTAVTAKADTWVEVQVGGVSFGRQKVGAVPYSAVSSTTTDVTGTVHPSVIAPLAVADGSLGRGANDASIYNDATRKTLVVTGNNAGGKHSVTLADSVVIGATAGAGALTVNGASSFNGNLTTTGKFGAGIRVLEIDNNGALVKQPSDGGFNVAQISLTCDSSEVAIAGGAECAAGYWLAKNRPLFAGNTAADNSPRGWHALCRNGSEFETPLYEYVLCMAHVN